MAPGFNRERWETSVLYARSQWSLFLTTHFVFVTTLPVKSLEHHETPNEQLWRRAEMGDVRMLGFFFFFFFGGCNHVLILETSWSTCSWLSYESWLVDEAQSHPSFSHKHTHTQTQTRGFPIARGRACCYCRLSLICLALCLATRLKRLHSIDRSPLILQVLGHRDAHTGDTVLYI